MLYKQQISIVYGESALAERTSFEFKDDQIKTLIENNWRYMTYELEILQISKTTLHEHIVKFGYINRYDVEPQGQK